MPSFDLIPYFSARFAVAPCQKLKWIDEFAADKAKQVLTEAGKSLNKLSVNKEINPWIGFAGVCTHLAFCSKEIVTNQIVCKDFHISRELDVGGKVYAEKDILSFYI